MLKFNPVNIDMHMHSTVSDGTDTPEEILANVKEKGLELFSLSDHDAIKGSIEIKERLSHDDPYFTPGIEFSCKDSEGQYHILGYGYDVDSQAMHDVVELGHSYRIKKLIGRLEFIKNEYGFAFPQEEIEKLFELDNPGKPHIGNLMVKYGYVDSKDNAIRNFIDNLHFTDQYVKPEEAIEAVLEAGGIPVLAHGFYGTGDQLILGAEMEERLQHLMALGLKGVEAYYSGFTKKLEGDMLALAEKYDLYVTAGSDYHGKNKLIPLGDTNLKGSEQYPDGLIRFLEDVKKYEGV